jgi:hypothetical protein
MDQYFIVQTQSTSERRISRLPHEARLKDSSGPGKCSKIGGKAAIVNPKSAQLDVLQVLQAFFANGRMLAGCQLSCEQISR